MTWSDIGDIRRVTGHNIPIQGVKFTCKPMCAKWPLSPRRSKTHHPCKPMFESISNGYRPKEVPFNFPPLTYNGEDTKLTSPWVTDVKILRYTFYRYFYGYQSLKVSRLSISRYSYDEHSNCFWGEVTTWPGDLTLNDLGLKFLHVRKTYINSAPWCRFLNICKNLRGVQTPPPHPATARANFVWLSNARQ